MPALAGPFAAAAALLVLAGAAKIWRPAETARALATLGLPGRSLLVRGLGATELLVGIAALSFGGRSLAVAVAVSYAGFAAVVALALRRRLPLASCGCFGRPDTPPTLAHLLVTAGFAAVAALAATSPVPGLVTVAGRTPLFGVPLVLLTGAVAGFGYLALAVLPTLAALSGRRP